MMKTLFLQAPSFEGFDGGAGARYQNRREIKSFWYPTWLAQPAALVEGSKLIDAPPHRLGLADVLPEVKDRDLVVLHTSTPSFASDVKTVRALKAANPNLKIGMIGAKVAVDAAGSLAACQELDFVARNEFDFTIKEVAEGRDFGSITGLSYRGRDGRVVHNTDRAMLASPRALGWIGNAGDVGMRPSNQRVRGPVQTSWPTLSSYVSTNSASLAAACSASIAFVRRSISSR